MITGGKTVSETEVAPAVERSALEKRLDELKRELRQGEERLRELDAERMRIHEALLRIEGAIVVLQELGGGDGNHRMT
jgi:predicted nuclease with TOPRIM domain